MRLLTIEIILVPPIVRGDRIERRPTLKIIKRVTMAGSILAIVKEIEAMVEGKIIVHARTDSIRTKTESPTGLCTIRLQGMSSASPLERKITSTMDPKITLVTIDKAMATGKVKLWMFRNHLLRKSTNSLKKELFKGKEVLLNHQAHRKERLGRGVLQDHARPKLTGAITKPSRCRKKASNKDSSQRGRTRSVVVEAAASKNHLSGPTLPLFKANPHHSELTLLPLEREALQLNPTD